MTSNSYFNSAREWEYKAMVSDYKGDTRNADFYRSMAEQNKIMALNSAVRENNSISQNTASDSHTVAQHNELTPLSLAAVIGGFIFGILLMLIV